MEENTSNSGPMDEKEQKSCEVSITITQGDVNNVTMDLDALLSDLDKVAQQAAENDGQNSLQYQQTEMRGARENPPRKVFWRCCCFFLTVRENLARSYKFENCCCWGSMRLCSSSNIL